MVVFLFLFAAVVSSPAKDTNAPVKTEFVGEAKLSPKQVATIVKLGKQCGIKQPALVETFQYIPGSQNGIQIQSAERVKGRVSESDWLEIHYTKWTNTKPDAKAKRLGDFWALPFALYTIRNATFDVGKQSYTMQLDKSLPLPTADLIVQALAAGKVVIESSASWVPEPQFVLAEVTSLAFDPREKHYCFHLKRQRYVYFDFIDGKIKVVQIAIYNI